MIGGDAFLVRLIDWKWRIWGAGEEDEIAGINPFWVVYSFTLINFKENSGHGHKCHTIPLANIVTLL